MIARLIAIKIGLALLLFSGCASAPKMAPRFTAPSTVEIRRATLAATKHIESAQAKVVVIEKECPGAKAEIDALSTDLLGAYNELQTSEGVRAQLDAQLQQQTQSANQLADNYDKAGATITTLKESRHGWVKRFWIASALLVAAGIWIFKGPLALTGIGI